MADDTDAVRCPFCSAYQDSIAGINHAERLPAAGDASICAVCAKISVFTGVGLRTRKPTRDEAAKIAAHPTARIAQRVIGRRGLLRDRRPDSEDPGRALPPV